MADQTRKVEAKFDGDTTGLSRAARDGEKIFDDFGRNASKKLGDGFEQEHKRSGITSFASAGISSAQGFAASLTVGIRNMHGPIMAALAAALVVGAPAVGAIAAGGIVAAFGIGLAGLGLAVTKNNPAVVREIEALKTNVSSRVKTMAQPFELVWVKILRDAQGTFDQFAPVLQKAFAKLAPITAQLSGSFFTALQQLAPVIGPVVDAFAEIADTLEPAIPAMVGGIASGIAKIAASVKENPTALADFFVGIGVLLEDALELVAALNDLNGQIEDLTGGVSAVEIVIGAIRGPILLVTGAVRGLTGFLGGLKKAWDAIAGIFRKKHTASITGNGSGFFSVIRSVQSTAGKWARSIFKAGISANGGGVGTVVSWAYRVGGGWAASIFKSQFSAIGDGAKRVYDYVNGLGNTWAGKVFKATFGATSLVGGLLGRASGGPVNAGQSYLVGERGPEVVTFGRSGHVTPNHMLGAATEVVVPIYIGDEVVRVVRQLIDARDRRMKRAVTAGATRGAYA